MLLTYHLHPTHMVRSISSVGFGYVKTNNRSLPMQRNELDAARTWEQNTSSEHQTEDNRKYLGHAWHIVWSLLMRRAESTPASKLKDGFTSWTITWMLEETTSHTHTRGVCLKSTHMLPSNHGSSRLFKLRKLYNLTKANSSQVCADYEAKRYTND